MMMSRLLSVRWPALFIPVLLMGGSLLIGGCGSDAQSTPELEPAVRPVKIDTAASRTTGDVREYPGTVAAAESATLSFEASGTVADLPVQEGESVQKGQLVARLDPEDARSRLDAAVAGRNAAESAHTRAQRLYEQGIVPLQELEARRRAVKQARSEVELARESLADTRLVAPFTGEVTETHVEHSETVGPAQSIVSVRDDARMEVMVDVPEQDQLRRTLRTASLHIVIPMLSDRRLPAELAELKTAAAPDTRTFEATLRFAPPHDADVLPGMTARAVVAQSAPSDSAAALTIPTTAVFSNEQGGAAVWVVDPSTMEVTAQPVETGALQGERVTVREGLSTGTQVAASGVHQLDDGQRVRPLTP